MLVSHGIELYKDDKIGRKEMKMLQLAKKSSNQMLSLPFSCILLNSLYRTSSYGSKWSPNFSWEKISFYSFYMKSLQNTNGLTSFCIKFIRKKMWVLNLQCKWVFEPMALPEKGVSHRQNFIVYKGIYLQPCDTLIYSKNHLSLTSIVLCSIINTNVRH